MHQVMYICLYSLSLIMFLLVGIAYFTLLDSKVMAAMQRRRGPNIVGFWGLLQPLSDGLKLFLKEPIMPISANYFLFLLAPCLVFSLSLLTWTLISYTPSGCLVDLETGAIVFLLISTLGVYGILLAGWSSNSKYAFLGALSSAAQMLSYEVFTGFIIISVLLCVGSSNLYTINMHQANTVLFWNSWFLWPQLMLFFFSGVAETNSAPFDLAEAEGELAAGYFIEYAGMAFALFFLGEYSNMLVICTLMSVLFCGGVTLSNLASIFFGFKIICFSFMFVWLSASFPRQRYDQLMALGWKSFLPCSIGLVMLVSSMLMGLDGLPSFIYV